MTPLFKILLVMHVLLGLLGTMAMYGVWLAMLKKSPTIKFLKIASFLAFISFMMSWLAGGYYYVKYYGDIVKPKILAGKYPWAHQIFTEAKEHIFMFLPFATLALAIVVMRMGNQFEVNEVLRKRVAFLAAALTVVATVVTLSGIIISGGR